MDSMSERRLDKIEFIEKLTGNPPKGNTKYCKKMQLMLPTHAYLLIT